MQLDVAQAAEAVDDQDLGFDLARHAQDFIASGNEPLRHDVVQAEKLYRAADQFGIEERERAQVFKQLARRLGERREHKNRFASVRGIEDDLAGERGLAAAGRTHNEYQRAARHTAAHDEIEIRHSGWLDAACKARFRLLDGIRFHETTSTNSRFPCLYSTLCAPSWQHGSRTHANLSQRLIRRPCPGMRRFGRSMIEVVYTGSERC